MQRVDRVEPRPDGRLRIRIGEIKSTEGDFDGLRKELGSLQPSDGWLRHASYYRLSADGLRLRYETADREVFRCP